MNFPIKRTIVLFNFYAVLASSGITTGNNKMTICWSTGLFVCGKFLLTWVYSSYFLNPIGFSFLMLPYFYDTPAAWSYIKSWARILSTHTLYSNGRILKHCVREFYVPITLSSLGEHMIYRIVCHDLCVGVNWSNLKLRANSVTWELCT